MWRDTCVYQTTPSNVSDGNRNVSVVTDLSGSFHRKVCEIVYIDAGGECVVGCVTPENVSPPIALEKKNCNCCNVSSREVHSSTEMKRGHVHATPTKKPFKTGETAHVREKHDYILRFFFQSSKWKETAFENAAEKQRKELKSGQPANPFWIELPYVAKERKWNTEGSLHGSVDYTKALAHPVQRMDMIKLSSHLIMKAAATFRTLGHLSRATMVSRLPITPVIMISTVMIAAKVRRPLENLERNRRNSSNIGRRYNLKKNFGFVQTYSGPFSSTGKNGPKDSGSRRGNWISPHTHPIGNHTTPSRNIFLSNFVSLHARSTSKFRYFTSTAEQDWNYPVPLKSVLYIFSFSPIDLWCIWVTAYCRSTGWFISFLQNLTNLPLPSGGKVSEAESLQRLRSTSVTHRCRCCRRSFRRRFNNAYIRADISLSVQLTFHDYYCRLF